MSDRKCPECGERLSFEAVRCACGWGLKKPDKGTKLYDHRCTYVAGGSRCAYPVGMFPEGATQGWCVFHRQQANGALGAEIVEQSKIVPYAEALKPIIARGAASPSVVNTAHEIALRVGNRNESGPFSEAMAALKRSA